MNSKNLTSVFLKMYNDLVNLVLLYFYFITIFVEQLQFK